MVRLTVEPDAVVSVLLAALKMKTPLPLRMSVPVSPSELLEQ